MALLENGYLPDRQRERQQPVHLPGHPRDVPRPVPGRELRRQRRRWRHDHLADAALVELRLRAPRSDRRHRQGGAAGAPDGHHHAARGRSCRCRSAPRRCYPIDMAGAVASIAADGHVAPAVLHRPGRGPRRRGDPRARGRPAAGRRRCSRPASRARCSRRTSRAAPAPGPGSPDQHAAGKTGTAQNASDGWFVGFTPYLATAVWIGSPDRQRARCEIGGTGHHRRLVPGRDLGPVHAGLARGPARRRECEEPERRTASSRVPVDWTATTTPGGGGGRPSTSPPSGPVDDADHDPARSRRPPRPPHRRCRRTRRPPPRRRRPTATTAAPTDPVSAALDEARGWRAHDPLGRPPRRPGARHHHRPAGAPAGAPARAGPSSTQVMAELARARGQRRRGRGRSATSSAATSSGSRTRSPRSTTGRTSTTRRSTAARSATPASSRRCRTRSRRSSGGSPSSRTRSSS